MSNALDAFRAQREAADQVHMKLAEVASLIAWLRQDVEALAHNRELHILLEREGHWLEEARRVVVEVREWRELEMRRTWTGVGLRWLVAVSLALASSALAGTAYARITRPYEVEIASLRSRLDFTARVEHRIITMTPGERRQFDALMKLTPSAVH